MKKATDSAATAATKQVDEATSAAKTALAPADKAAADAQAQGASITSKVQQTIDNVRKMLAEKNWTDALKQLNELAGMKLTPEQQSMVDGLKQQAQQLAQSATAAQAGEQANKAIGNLLKK
jgi:hypothetical protein